MLLNEDCLPQAGSLTRFVRSWDKLGECYNSRFLRRSVISDVSYLPGSRRAIYILEGLWSLLFTQSNARLIHSADAWRLFLFKLSKYQKELKGRNGRWKPMDTTIRSVMSWCHENYSSFGLTIMLIIYII